MVNLELLGTNIIHHHKGNLIRRIVIGGIIFMTLVNTTNTIFEREVKNTWYVSFNEQDFPHIQQAFILHPDKLKEHDPFILLAEDWFKRGTFSDHPHCGFQTITYIIDGRLEHIDNGGGHDIIESGDVQYMNAGRGARHAEEPVDDDITHSLQLWLNLPKSLKTTKPFYQNIYSEIAPVVSFEGGSIKVYSGQIEDVKGPMEPLVPLILSEITLFQHTEYTLNLPENHNAFIYVLSGDINLGTQCVNLRKTGVATLTYKEDGDSLWSSKLSIKANKKSKLLVYSGKPIKEEVVAYGPFVMNTMEEIKEAYKDFEEGKFGPQVN
jgi:hypothetical protein